MSSEGVQVDVHVQVAVRTHSEASNSLMLLVYVVEVYMYRIAGNFDEVLMWRIGEFTENRQVKTCQLICSISVM